MKMAVLRSIFQCFAIIFAAFVVTTVGQGPLNCGRRNPRILPLPSSDMGTESLPYSWPWMAGIYIQVNGGPRNFLCAGTLLSREHVLTAAHCFSGLSTEPSNFAIALKVHDVLSSKDGEIYGVSNIKIHENFQNGEFYDDIALVRLNETIRFQAGISPVCLPPLTYKLAAIEGAATGVVIGWGDLTFGTGENRTLQEITVPMITNEECVETYNRVITISFPEGLDQSLMCTSHGKGGSDPCQGDSGGPLMVHLGGIRWFQVGIVSFGQGCAAPGFPGLYTRVTHFREWIYQNTGL